MKQIFTKKGQIILVDDEDYNWLSQYKWHISKKGYAKHGKKCEKMHQMIYEKYFDKLPKNHVVDHINRIPSDNRKENLRKASNAENARNSKVRKDSTSCLKGVLKNRDQYTVYIIVNSQRIYLGSYKIPEDAAKAYDIGALIFHKNFANTNFPKENYNLNNINLPITTRHKNKKYMGIEQAYKNGRYINKWMTRFLYEKKRKCYGTFSSEIEAAQHYDRIKIQQNPNIWPGLLNFPDNHFPSFVAKFI